MHPNNIHNNSSYDFSALIATHPILQQLTFINTFGNTTIDFSNPKAVLELNRAILKHYYKLIDWNIPEGYLCPPIPGRADYIHHLADILSNKKTKNAVPKGLDIGTGANCIYPILGSQLYNWNMVGVDIDEKAIVSATNNVTINPHLSDMIEVRFQSNPAHIFDGIIKSNEYFDFVMCNPPFHTSKEEATKGTLRKLQNLGKTKDVQLNFGGQANELWCNGGEALFLKRMIKQSVSYAKQIGIFTSLVSKKENLPKLEKQLNKLNAIHFSVEMSQGNKKSRFIAWSYK
ncbi:23S rRNA (adenine(1618)-N(6))-methyltransferase RlmF [Aquimarina longa]|uniref:23S rRNA (adenine(1618)-N(6))-methyltransferase RlmF n=1 Tax=Aquimarina longa TaxID=1080221 RepID=UPI000784485F|nr:23S rRNA (adenine(1618)-N(6))-methyltransferase RlmF [Aquimarina longa]